MGRMPEDDEVDSSSALTDPESHVGLTFRALQTLFRGIANRGSTYKYEVRITLLELYNEAWADLLVGAEVGTAVSEDKDELASDGDEGEAEPTEEPKSSTRSSGGTSNGDKDSKGPRLTVRKGASGMYVDGAACRRVSNVGEVIALLQYGYKLRHVEATQLNEASSRSHLLLQVDVIGTNQATQVSSHGRLALVDLAGSVDTHTHTTDNTTTHLPVRRELHGLLGLFVMFDLLVADRSLCLCRCPPLVPSPCLLLTADRSASRTAA